MNARLEMSAAPALRRPRAGAILLFLQVLIAYAILANASFIVRERLGSVARPTGLDEANLLLVTQSWTASEFPAGTDRTERSTGIQRADVAALSSIGGVEAVSTVNSLPLLGWLRPASIGLEPEQSGPTLRGSYYFVDERAVPTLGLRIISGRNFESSEVRGVDPKAIPAPDVCIISKDAATLLGFGPAAVGKTIYLEGRALPTRIIGIVDRLQGPLSSTNDESAYVSLLVPGRLGLSMSRYAVRVKDGTESAVRAAIPEALYGITPRRLVDKHSVRSFSEIRASAYQSDKAVAVSLAIISTVMLAVTAVGVAGHVAAAIRRRRAEIGVRRALGATKWHIVRMFLLENLLVCGAAVASGLPLAFGLNGAIHNTYGAGRIDAGPILVAGIFLICICQIVILLSTRLILAIQPAEAIRN